MIDSSVLFGMDGIIYGMARPFFLFKWNYVITERSNEMFKWSQHWRHRRPHTQLPNHNVRTFNASEGWLEGESLLILSQFFSYCSSPVLIKTYCTSAFALHIILDKFFNMCRFLFWDLLEDNLFFFFFCYFYTVSARYSNGTGRTWLEEKKSHIKHTWKTSLFVS